MRKTWIDIRNEIQSRVLSRRLKPGEKLPTDQELAEEFGCARTTVQRAMTDLAQRGVVVRKRKGGTSIAQHPVTRATLDIPITRIEVERLGRDYGYRLLSRAIEPVPPHVAERFGLDEKPEMLHIRSLHLADDQPYIFEDRWISLATAGEILDVDLGHENANEWLVLNKPYSECEVRFMAARAETEQARLLNATVGEALFVLERTTWIDSQPITMVRALTAPGYQLITMAR